MVAKRESDALEQIEGVRLEAEQLRSGDGIEPSKPGVARPCRF